MCVGGGGGGVFLKYIIIDEYRGYGNRSVPPQTFFFVEEPYVIITQGHTKQPHVNNTSVYVTADCTSQGPGYLESVQVSRLVCTRKCFVFSSCTHADGV